MSDLNADVDAMLEASQQHSVSFLTLREAGPLIVTVYDHAAAARALDRAVARLDCQRPRLRFVYAPGRARGQANQLRDGACVVSVNLAEIRTCDEIAEVVFHEAQHVADFHIGEFRRLSAAARERKAIRFAREMVQECSR